MDVNEEQRQTEAANPAESASMLRSLRGSDKASSARSNPIAVNNRTFGRNRLIWILVGSSVLMTTVAVAVIIYAALACPNSGADMWNTGSAQPTGSKSTSSKNPETINPVCLLPLEDGPCRGGVPVYGFNSDDWLCQVFLYSGCKGNENRFATLEECQQACY